MKPWPKSSPEAVERFHAAAAGVEGVELRRMFGFPAAFVGGNLAASLFGDTMAVRLPEDELRARQDAGWSPFEPMPGRPMRGYVALPDEVVRDAAAARHWVEQAVAYGRTLPPKEPKRRKR
jgi:TfoX/Sxy family transcriptional regulator of competence genes